MSQWSKSEMINIAIVSIIWIIMVILVNPYDDFPLNDDWAYGRSVQSVIEKADFQLSGWTATNLFSQVFWGALFCLPFNFSFTALRFSTLTLGLIGVITTYGLLREINAPSIVSFSGALIVAINPMFFSLSNTFMSDVPFFAFATLALYFLVRGYKRHSTIAVVFGTITTCIAILDRQLGLAIPLAFSFTYITKKRFNIQNFIKGFWLTLLGLSIQIFYQIWLQSTKRVPDVNFYSANANSFFKLLFESFSRMVLHFDWRPFIFIVLSVIFVFSFFIISFSSKLKELSAWEKKFDSLCSINFFCHSNGVFFIERQENAIIA
jgi:hypothetical protein